MIRELPQIPCVESRCLLFPVCRNKYSIRCEDLFFYMKSINEVLDDTKDSIWLEINKIFKNLYEVKFESKSYGPSKTIKSAFPPSHLRYMDEMNWKFIQTIPITYVFNKDRDEDIS